MKLLKNLLTIIIVCLLFASCNQVEEQQVLVPQMYKQEIEKADSPQLVDVRTPDEFNEGHLEGAININYHGNKLKEQFAALDREKAVYVYCRSGGRSGKTSAILQDMGFKEVIDMKGGITKWQKEGYKVVK